MRKSSHGVVALRGSRDQASKKHHLSHYTPVVALRGYLSPFHSADGYALVGNYAQTGSPTEAGQGKAALSAGAGRRSPRSSFLPTVRRLLSPCLSAVCRARYASPTPARVEHNRPCEVKAAQVVGMMGRGALVLALTRMVDLANPHGRQHRHLSLARYQNRIPPLSRRRPTSR